MASKTTENCSSYFSSSGSNPSLRVILARVEEFIGLFETIVGQALREVRGPKPNTRLAAHILTFLPVMLALRRLSLYRDLTLEQVVDVLTDFPVRGLGLEGGND
jgi:hypothetical protein